MPTVSRADRIKVAVLDDYQGRAHEFADWSSLGADVEVVFFRDPIAPGDLAPALDDVEYLRQRGVVVCGTGGSSVRGQALPPPGIPSTAEVAWALILALAKRVTLEDKAIRAGRWQLDLPVNLAGATLGLVGLKNLGGSMVAPARAFGMEVIAWSANLTEERAASLGVSRVTKAQLLSRADYLSIHLVDTSRGPIVDEVALVDALQAGTIAAAGLDVYDREPLPPGHPLTTLENVILLPHLGYVSEAALRNMYGQVVEDIAAFRDGRPIRTI